MLNSWLGLTLLAFESTAVIGLRLVKISRGGVAAFDEVNLMINEKLLANAAAVRGLSAGVGIPVVIGGYREVVAGNFQRLSGFERQ